MVRFDSPEALETFRQEILSKRDPNKPCITLCSGSGCHRGGWSRLSGYFYRLLRARNIHNRKT